jgi:hypothetical protein
MAQSYSDVLPFYGLDDDSFNLEIFELNTGPVNFNTHSLASLSYNPNPLPSPMMRTLIRISIVI